MNTVDAVDNRPTSHYITFLLNIVFVKSNIIIFQQSQTLMIINDDELRIMCVPNKSIIN